MHNSAHWSDREIRELLTIRHDASISSSISGTVSDSKVYDKIAASLSERGVHRTKEQCKSKLKCLKQRFLTTVSKSGDGCSTWEYFELCSGIWGNGRSTTPKPKSESMELRLETQLPGFIQYITDPDTDGATEDHSMEDSSSPTENNHSNLKERSTAELKKEKSDKRKMSATYPFDVDVLDSECLLDTKIQLQQEGPLDPILQATLEHAMQTLERLPVAKLRDASLTLEGETKLVRIVAGTPVLHYTVKMGANGPELHQRVRIIDATITHADISDAHFSGHRCQDEIVPCLDQARQALGGKNGPGWTDGELRIVCNELRLTYSTHEPMSIIEIRPHRRVRLSHYEDFEKILKVKNHLEQSGATGKGLLACLNYLLVNLRKYNGANYYMDFPVMLQSEGEMMELHTQSCPIPIRASIFTDSNNEIHTYPQMPDSSAS